MVLFAFFLISTGVHITAPAGIISPGSFPLSHNTALALRGKHVLWELARRAVSTIILEGHGHPC